MNILLTNGNNFGLKVHFYQPEVPFIKNHTFG